MKTKRHQSRKLTPPLVLRNDEGDTEIVEVDTLYHTTNHTWISRKISARLILGPGLRIRIGSRCQTSKKRLTEIHVTCSFDPKAKTLGFSALAASSSSSTEFIS